MRAGGASAFFHAPMRAVRRKSRAPNWFRRGSGAPNPANACPTLRKASSTVRDRTGRRLGARAPVRYQWAKSCKTGMRSPGQSDKQGAMPSSAQKADQRRIEESEARPHWRETRERVVS